MPEVARKITIDRKRKKVYINDVEIPWMVSDPGPQVSGTDSDNLSLVIVPLLAVEVEDIPECAECARLDSLGVEYATVTNHAGTHLRHIPDVDAARAKVLAAEDELAEARRALESAGYTNA